MGRKKIYTDEELKEHKRLKAKQYYNDNKELISQKRKNKRIIEKDETREKDRKSYQKNREQKLEYKKMINSTPIGKANNMSKSYKTADKKHNRGECTITGEWMVDNIFTSKCFYCKESDWTKLGCDRIDNDLPHTPDNVVCCCEDCNKKRGTKSFEEFCRIMGVKPIVIKTETTYI